jgi:hypothetical protein
MGAHRTQQHADGYGGWKGSKLVIVYHFIWCLSVALPYIMLQVPLHSLGPIPSKRLQGGLKN